MKAVRGAQLVGKVAPEQLMDDPGDLIVRLAQLDEPRARNGQDAGRLLDDDGGRGRLPGQEGDLAGKGPTFEMRHGSAAHLDAETARE